MNKPENKTSPKKKRKRSKTELSKVTLIFFAVDFRRSDRYRPAQDVMQCTFRNSDYIFVGILGAYKVLIMIAGLLFSVKIWNFRMSEFNESKPIAFGMYNLIFFMILAIVAVGVFDTVTQVRKTTFRAFFDFSFFFFFFGLGKTARMKFDQKTSINSNPVIKFLVLLRV